MRKIILRRLPDRIAWLGFTSLLIVIRLKYPPRDLSVTGFEAVLDTTLTLIFWLVIIFTHQALGKTTIRKLIGDADELCDVLSLPVGFGISGSIIAFFGMIRALSPTVLIVYAGVLIFFVSEENSALFAASIRRLRNLTLRSSEGHFYKFAKGSAVLIAGLSFLNALVPPWSYDALMYHLPGPDQFLTAGSIFPDLDNWYVNGPFAVEMLFTLGLAIEDAIIPKLIHWSFGVSLIAVTHVFARRWFDKEIAWLSTLVMLTIPIIPIISGFAYIDLAWATFEFGGFACLLAWQKENKRSWLTVSGILLGLAAGSKYLGLMGLATAGLFFLYIQLRKKSSTFTLDVLSLAGPVLVLGLPWYLKNWITLGNPVYPLYFGGPGWDKTRLDLYMGYLNEFGTGRTLRDFILLPWNIYARHEEFGAVFNQNDIPSLLFPLALTLVFLPKKTSIKALIYLTLIRIVLWSVGSHQVRFLLPVYPMVSILTGYSIQQLILRFKQMNLLGFFLRTLAVALTFITIFYQIQLMRSYHTLSYSSGMLSGEGFLSNASRDYPAKDFLLNVEPIEGKVLLLGDGRVYYCQSICIPDPDHFRWAYTLKELNSPENVGNWFVKNDIIRLLISTEDLGFLLDHDPEGIIAQAIEVLTRFSGTGCLTLEYEDENSTVYSTNCQLTGREH